METFWRKFSAGFEMSERFSLGESFLVGGGIFNGRRFSA
jgi:hypothetical protein